MCFGNNEESGERVKDTHGHKRRLKEGQGKAPKETGVCVVLPSCVRVCEEKKGKEEPQSHNKSLSMSESENRKTITLEGKQ